jgi:hypothetical protein
LTVPSVRLGDGPPRALEVRAELGPLRPGAGGPRTLVQAFTDETSL